MTYNFSARSIVLLRLIDILVTRYFISNSMFYLLQPRFAYSCMDFGLESCLAVAYSIHFQALVAEVQSFGETFIFYDFCYLVL